MEAVGSHFGSIEDGVLAEDLSKKRDNFKISASKCQNNARTWSKTQCACVADGSREPNTREYEGKVAERDLVGTDVIALSSSELRAVHNVSLHKHDRVSVLRGSHCTDECVQG